MKDLITTQVSKAVTVFENTNIMFVQLQTLAQVFRLNFAAERKHEIRHEMLDHSRES